MSDEPSNHWSVDRRVPLALIITLVIQTGGFFFYMGETLNRVSTLERQYVDERNNGQRLTRVETQLEGINKAVTSIERNFDRILKR